MKPAQRQAYIVQRDADGLYYSDGEWVQDWRQATMFDVCSVVVEVLCEDHVATGYVVTAELPGGH